MGIDMNVIVERYNGRTFKWEAVKKEDKTMTEGFKKRLREIRGNRKKHLEAIFNGKIEKYEEKIAEYKNNLYWVNVDRNYAAYELLVDTFPSYRGDVERLPHAYKLSPESWEELGDAWYTSLNVYDNQRIEELLEFFEHSYSPYVSSVSNEIYLFLKSLFLTPLQKLKSEGMDKVRFLVYTY